MDNSDRWKLARWVRENNVGVWDDWHTYIAIDYGILHLDEWLEKEHKDILQEYFCCSHLNGLRCS